MSAWAALWLMERRRRIAAERRSGPLPALPPRSPSAALAAARAGWEGQTVVYRDRSDMWWGCGHRHRVGRITEGAPGDIVVSLQCLGCPRHGPVGLVVMDGWDIVVDGGPTP